MADDFVSPYPPDYVAIAAPDRGLFVLARVGDGTPTVSGGVGGWEAVPRPLRRPLTVWRGTPDPLTLSLPILLDGFDEDKPVEKDVRTLEKMGGLDRGDPEPPELIVEGAVPHSETHRGRWVLNGLDWGDAIRRASDGQRVRQAVTLTLVLKVDDDRLDRIRHAQARPTYRYVHARPGDTYEKIAARELKLKRLGSRLARLNGGRSPDVKLPKNHRVKLPTGGLLTAWKKGY